MSTSLNKHGLSLDVAVFICGAVVMIFEITGSRVLAPFIGTSTYIWTSLIGVILGALSLGYWLGGRVADRVPRTGVLAAAIMTAAGLIAVTILIKDVALTGIAAFPVWLEMKAVIAALLLFAPASVALGFVTPYAVKLRMESLGEAGRTVGRLYALSTVGSIAGTFLAGFVFIPFLGSIRTLYLITVLLVLASAMLVPFALTRRNVSVLLVFAFAVVAHEATLFAMWRMSAFEDIETEYSRVYVFDTVDAETQKAITAMTFDPYSTQSAIFKDSNELVFEYTKFYHLVRVLKPDFQRSLMIGGAGYSFPKAYRVEYPHASMDVVEIDPRMTEIARRRFRLEENERLRIFHQDGRVFLNNAPDTAYDAVLMDAFGSLLSVPFHLTTIEAVRHIDRVLTDDGVAVLNIGSAIRGPASGFLQSEFATYKSVFPFVHVFKVRTERPDTDLQNLILVACKRECLPTNQTADAFINSLLTRQHTADFPLTLPELTDDLAPVERYSSIAQGD